MILGLVESKFEIYGGITKYDVYVMVKDITVKGEEVILFIIDHGGCIPFYNSLIYGVDEI